MKNTITTKTYGAYINTKNSWWRATLTSEKLNPPKKPENKGHANPAIQAIHDNPNLTRDEKIALAKRTRRKRNRSSRNGHGQRQLYNRIYTENPIRNNRRSYRLRESRHSDIQRNRGEISQLSKLRTGGDCCYMKRHYIVNLPQVII